MELTYTNLMLKAQEWERKANQYKAMDADDMAASEYRRRAEEACNAAEIVLGSTAVSIDDDATLISMGCAQRRVSVAPRYTQYDDNADTENRWFDINGEMMESFEYEGRAYYAVYPFVHAPQRPTPQEVYEASCAADIAAGIDIDAVPAKTVVAISMEIPAVGFDRVSTELSEANEERPISREVLDWLKAQGDKTTQTESGMKATVKYWSKNDAERLYVNARGACAFYIDLKTGQRIWGGDFLFRYFHEIMEALWQNV